MSSLPELFANNLLPVFLAAGAGYLAAARLDVSARPVARVAFHLFAPCLILHLILDNHVGVHSLLRMGAFTLLVLAVPAGLIWLLARGRGWPRTRTAAAVLIVLLPNAGNFGLSTNLFAFGEPGLVEATLFFVTSAILSYTVGVFVASLGRMRFLPAFLGLIRVPGVLAVAVGLLLVHFGKGLPLPVDRTVTLFSDAAIPVFLVVLGMQLRGVRGSGPWSALALTSSFRLLGGMAAGLLGAMLFGLEGPARQAGVLQSSMPTAVITIILAAEYDAEPGFVTAAVTATTLLSPLTLTPLLAYLGA